jgi:hypothetical protein
MYPEQTPPRRTDPIFGGQGPQSNIPFQGPENNFSARGSEPNFGMQGHQGQFGGRGPEPNFGRHGNENNFNTQGPSFNQQGNQEPSEPMPVSSAEIKAYIKKKPYTQTLGGQEFTYSLLPKKQQTFVMTHDRFLLLKGTDLIGYARELPEKIELPFRSLE